MDELNIAEGSVVGELGAGSGWFTIQLARRVQPTGKVYAEDIQPQMIEVIRRRVPRENLSDKVVVTILGTAADPKLPVGELDAVLICDAYHEMEQPVALLRNAARALKKNGRLGIVEFTRAGGGPGPLMDERVDPERVIREASEAGLRLIARPNMLRYQVHAGVREGRRDCDAGPRAAEEMSPVPAFFAGYQTRVDEVLRQIVVPERGRHRTIDGLYALRAVETRAAGADAALGGAVRRTVDARARRGRGR